MTEQLTAFELTLLPRALEFAKENPLTRDALRRFLGCGAEIAMRLIRHIQEGNMVKVATHLEKLPVDAETRAETQFTLGDTSGTAYSYVLRENARLTRELAKYRHKTAAEKEQRATEIRAEIEELKTLAKSEIGAVKKLGKPRDIPEGDLMMELAIPDLHVGKLAHSSETGRRPYDVKIAIATFNRALEGLLERTKHYPISKVVLVAGNDLFHTDNERNTTTSGTAVSTDGRFFKTFRETRKMMVSAIERLRKVAEVKVIICVGNHDAQTSYHLGDSLECFFTNDPMVTVDNSPAPRKYFAWGNVLLGWCHGHEGKHSDYALLMAAEQREAWGKAKWVEMHCGHYHRLQTTEDHGVRVRLLGALTEADDWHAHMGFIGAIRQAESFIWSKREGLISECFWNDDAQEPIITTTEIV